MNNELNSEKNTRTTVATDIEKNFFSEINRV